MNEQEIEDTESLQKTIRANKIVCFDFLVRCIGLDAKELNNWGHESVEAALLYHINYTIEVIENLVATYDKKYPDYYWPNKQ